MHLKRKPASWEYVDKAGGIKSHKKGLKAAKKVAARKVAARRLYEKHLKEGKLSYQEFRERLENFYTLFFVEKGKVMLMREQFKKDGIDLDRIEVEHPKVFKGLSELVYELQMAGRKGGGGGGANPHKWSKPLKDRWFNDAMPRLYEAYKFLRKKGLNNRELGLRYWF